MLTTIEDVADYVVAFRATGEVTKKDYDEILMPSIDHADKVHGHIHFLFVLETPVKNFSIGAWLEDAWIGLKHYRGWKKVAIVSNEHGVEVFTNKFTFFIPGKTRGFKLSELELAKKWVAEED
jgi:hypothetical protein